MTATCGGVGGVIGVDCGGFDGIACRTVKAKHHEKTHQSGALMGLEMPPLGLEPRTH